MTTDTERTTDVPLSCLKKLAVATVKRRRHTGTLSERDKRKLELVASGKESRYDSAAYGALMPKDAVDKRATDSLLQWTAFSVCNYCFPASINTAVQTPYLFVHSQTVSAALDAYNRAGRPTADFALGSADWMRPHSLVTLRSQLDAEQCATLADVLELRFAVFVLHGEHHWSLLVYDTKDRDLCHVDSMPESETVRGIHEDRRFHCMYMLKALRLIPEETQLFSLKRKVVQNGAWQCGYAVAVFLAHFSDTLRHLMSPALTASRIVVDDELLAQFGRALLTEAEINERCAAYTEARLGHVYVDK